MVFFKETDTFYMKSLQIMLWIIIITDHNCTMTHSDL